MKLRFRNRYFFQMELQNPIDPKDMRGCKILSKTREINIELDTKDVSSTRFALTVPAGVQPDNYYVLCSVDNTGYRCVSFT